MILGVDHVQITVAPADVERARTFYCDLLGLKEIKKPASLQKRGGFWVVVGNQQVHVGVEEGVERLRTKAHIAYRVSDLQCWRQKLAEAGLELVESIPIEGFERVEARDPFGNRIEFIRPI